MRKLLFPIVGLVLFAPVTVAAQPDYSESIAEALEEPEKIIPAPYVAARSRHANASVSAISYSGCDEVRISGRAPLYVGQPGYHPSMDSDYDGIACEYYPGALEEAIARTAQRARKVNYPR